VTSDQTKGPLAASDILAAVGRIAGQEPERRRAVPTGFHFLDEAMGGWRTGLHIVAGAPGSGKSAFALHAANAAAEAGVPVLYVCFEQQLDILVLRLLCQRTGWPLRDAQDGKIPSDEVSAACEEHAEAFSRLHVYQADASDTIDTLKGFAQGIMARHGATTILLVVDYLQLWAAGNRDFSEFRHEIAKLTTALRHVSLELDCPVIALSSQRREAQGEPSLNSLEGTSDLEYTADTVTFLVHIERSARQSDYGPADDALTKALSVSVNLRKNRFGEPGSRIVKFYVPSATFDDETIRRQS
jgi:replicative DNA helicase